MCACIERPRTSKQKASVALRLAVIYLYNFAMSLCALACLLCIRIPFARCATDRISFPVYDVCVYTCALRARSIRWVSKISSVRKIEDRKSTKKNLVCLRIESTCVLCRGTHRSLKPRKKFQQMQNQDLAGPCKGRAEIIVIMT